MRTALFSAVIALGFSTTLAAQSGAGTEWRYWGGDAGSTRYSPLDQITAGNAGQLEVAWRWRAIARPLRRVGDSHRGDAHGVETQRGGDGRLGAR